MELIRKQLYFKASSFDDKDHIIRGIFSTGIEDRQGEVIDQRGWKLDEYMQNPVVLAFHDHWQPAIGQMIELFLNERGELEGAVKFAVDEYDVAETFYNLYKGRYMRAFSVGFENLLSEIDAEGKLILRENKLYEISCVNVPANAMALAMQKGMDMGKINESKKKAIENLNKKELEEKKADKKTEKSQACRMEGETKDECVARKVPELMDEGKTQEEAVGAAEGICSVACSEKAVEALSKASKETIQEAIKTLTEVLGPLGTDNKVAEKVEHPSTCEGGKKISVKTFNKVIRDLLKVRSEIK